jgi:hypothetical protein
MPPDRAVVLLFEGHSVVRATAGHAAVGRDRLDLGRLGRTAWSDRPAARRFVHQVAAQPRPSFDRLADQALAGGPSTATSSTSNPASFSR